MWSKIACHMGQFCSTWQAKNAYGAKLLLMWSIFPPAESAASAEPAHQNISIITVSAASAHQQNQQHQRISSISASAHQQHRLWCCGAVALSLTDWLTEWATFLFWKIWHVIECEKVTKETFFEFFLTILKILENFENFWQLTIWQWNFEKFWQFRQMTIL